MDALGIEAELTARIEARDHLRDQVDAEQQKINALRAQLSAFYAEQRAPIIEAKKRLSRVRMSAKRKVAKRRRHKVWTMRIEGMTFKGIGWQGQEPLGVRVSGLLQKYMGL